jgi:hypothetical protein
MIAASELMLRKAILLALRTDVDLVSRLGGPKIYDEGSTHTQMPYVVFGDSRARDWSTASDQGAEHTLALDVWSEHRGVSEVLEISALIATALSAAALFVPGYRIILLSQQSIETRRQNSGRHARARLMFRITIEKI